MRNMIKPFLRPKSAWNATLGLKEGYRKKAKNDMSLAQNKIGQMSFKPYFPKKSGRVKLHHLSDKQVLPYLYLIYAGSTYSKYEQETHFCNEDESAVYIESSTSEKQVRSDISNVRSIKSPILRHQGMEENTKNNVRSH